jgi:hypothetical protein
VTFEKEERVSSTLISFSLEDSFCLWACDCFSAYF